MGRVRTMRQEDIDWMLANYEQCTIDECARQLNISVRTVSRWADSLGLNKINQRHTTPRIQENRLRCKDCLIRKCCLICGKYAEDTCETAQSMSPETACKLVCFDFELRKGLMIE